MTERLTDRLSPLARAALEAILGDAVTVIGTVRPIQTIVDLALPHIEILLSGGLSPTELCVLLAEHGVLGAEGAAFPKSSLTSALSRARRKVAGRSLVTRRTRLQTAAVECEGPLLPASSRMELQPAASSRTGLQPAASSRTGLQPPAFYCNGPPPAASGCSAPHSTSLDALSLRTEEQPLESHGHPRGGPGPPMHRMPDRMSPTRKRASTLSAIQDLERPHDQE